MGVADARTHIIASGDKIVLRDRLPSDVDSYVRWMTDGEWRKYDAPWEVLSRSHTEEEIRKRFSEKLTEDLPSPRSSAYIADKENKPLGWVNRYGDKRFPSAWSIGIDICEDGYLNRGLGTESFGLWLDYLFSNSDVHRIGFSTYWFNKRMIRVGQKLDFAYEGTRRQIILWKDEWVDRIHFGMLRSEWEERRNVGSSCMTPRQ